MDSTVFVMDVNSTITGPDVQRGFHPEARYEFKVHFDPPGHETLTYRVSFGESDSEGRQAPQLHALTGEAAREDTAAGTFVLEGRTGEPASRGDTRIWAGRIADPFYIDLSLLIIVNSAVQNMTAAAWPAWHPENARNSFADTTVESIVLEVSHEHPQLHAGAHIGVFVVDDVHRASWPSDCLDRRLDSVCYMRLLPDASRTLAGRPDSGPYARSASRGRERALRGDRAGRR